MTHMTIRPSSSHSSTSYGAYSAQAQADDDSVKRARLESELAVFNLLTGRRTALVQQHEEESNNSPPTSPSPSITIGKSSAAVVSSSSRETTPTTVSTTVKVQQQQEEEQQKQQSRFEFDQSALEASVSSSKASESRGKKKKSTPQSITSENNKPKFEFHRSVGEEESKPRTAIRGAALMSTRSFEMSDAPSEYGGKYSVGSVSTITKDTRNDFMGSSGGVGGGILKLPPALLEAGQSSSGDDQSVATVYSRISNVAAATMSVTGQFLAKLNGIQSGEESSQGGDDNEDNHDHMNGTNKKGSSPTSMSSGSGGRGRNLVIITPSDTIDEGDEGNDDSATKGTTSHGGGQSSISNMNHKPAGVISFLDDDKSEMTFGRILALKLMHNKWYYNPEAVLAAESKRREDFKSKHFGKSLRDIGAAMDASRDVERGGLSRGVSGGGGSAGTGSGGSGGGPSLEKAWAYFEHSTLPRYLVPNIYSTSARNDNTSKKAVLCGKCGYTGDKLDCAEPGEDTVPTKLYSPLFTPLSQMGDFGLGIGLYFSTLRALMILTLLAGLMNIPNLLYYSSPEYDSYVEGKMSVKFLLRGSAICTNQFFVPCVDCELKHFRRSETRFATSNPDGTGDVYALKNGCFGAQMEQVMINYGTLFLVFVGVLLMNKYQNIMEVNFDEDEQTCQDYSIVVNNPPSDAYDPEEWREYFSKFGDAHASVCTVTLGNDVLLRALAERRERLRQLEMLLPVGESLDMNHIARLAAQMEANANWLSNIPKLFHPLGLMLDVPYLYGKIVVLDARIRGLAQRNYPVTKVFVSFETEEAQRRVLSELSYAPYKVWMNDVSAIHNDDFLFRGKRLLRVRESAEPSSVRWQDLDQSLRSQVIHISVTTFVCLCAVVMVAFIVMICYEKDAKFAGFAIAIFNTVFPLFAKAMTNMEAHPSEGGKQGSLYIKIAVFRWVNTAIVIRLINPFTSTLTTGDENLIYGVYVIFFAEIITVNLIQYADIGGNIQRHFVGPRAPNQERMNLSFRGTPYDLAERYTTVTKILFFCFFYSSIFPGGFFFSALSFFLTYYVDRFSLMRSWSRAPRLGKQIAEFSRKYFFSATILAFAFVSSYMWTGFPYDNLCDTGETVSSQGAQNITVYPAGGVGSPPPGTSTTLIRPGDSIYKFCNQDYLEIKDGGFPALPTFQPPESRWMTDEQERATWIYGWTSIAYLGLIGGMFAWRMWKKFMNIFRGGYRPTGRDMNINFSDVPSINSYVPEVSSDTYPFPLIACNIDDIDEGLLSWKDPDRDFDYYNLIKDVEGIFKGSNHSPARHAFSVIRQWKPPDDFFDDEDNFLGVSEVTMTSTHNQF